MKTKVLIVDDSALVRKMLTNQLENNKEIEVVGSAPDPFVARDMILKYEPDVIILDIEMPRMDGLTFLKKLMLNYPKRVIVLSSLAKKGGEVAMKAYEYGALEVIAKPSYAYSIQDMTEQLIDKVLAVARVPDRILKSKTYFLSNNNNKETLKTASLIKTTKKIVAIGASTGGTEAINKVLLDMPINAPPIIIVQHMPKYFTKSFAERLNEQCTIEVKEATNGELLTSGKALIAPGDIHMELARSGAVYFVKLVDGPMLFHQKPAVDILFYSVAKYAGNNAIGVLLTGMGQDGAEGLLKMKTAGAHTIAQDEDSCVVFGMPRKAIEINAVDKVLSLDKMCTGILNNI